MLEVLSEPKHLYIQLVCLSLLLYQFQQHPLLLELVLDVKINRKAFLFLFLFKVIHSNLTKIISLFFFDFHFNSTTLLKKSFKRIDEKNSF